MANGFQAVRVQGTSGTCGIIETFFLDGTTDPVAIGDVVVAVAGNSLTNNGTGFSTVSVLTSNITAGTTVVGVVVGFEVDPSNLLRTGRTVGDGNAIVRVAIDANQVYAVEVDLSTVPSTSIGKNFGIDAATPATINGNLMTSNMTIQGESLVATVAWRVVGADPDTYDADTNSFTRVYVKPNESFYRFGQLGV
jgi:hypothetical protein